MHCLPSPTGFVYIGNKLAFHSKKTKKNDTHADPSPSSMFKTRPSKSLALFLFISHTPQLILKYNLAFRSLLCRLSIWSLADSLFFYFSSNLFNSFSHLLTFSTLSVDFWTVIFAFDILIRMWKSLLAFPGLNSRPHCSSFFFRESWTKTLNQHSFKIFAIVWPATFPGTFN